MARKGRKANKPKAPGPAQEPRARTGSAPTPPEPAPALPSHRELDAAILRLVVAHERAGGTTPPRPPTVKPLDPEPRTPEIDGTTTGG
jgi:hypothetical protein